MSYQKIVPYLQGLRKLNSESHITFEKTKEENIARVFMSFRFMEGLLKFVKPVVSMDACHVRHKAGGIIYTAMVHTGSGDALPIGFAICHGPENFLNWAWMVRNIKLACPSLEKNNFVIVSDKDKGLGKALLEFLPFNLSMNCMFHIKQNVQNKFGVSFAHEVFTLGRTFNMEVYDSKFQETRRHNEAKTERFQKYMEDMPRFSWRSLDWVINGQRYISWKFGLDHTIIGPEDNNSTIMHPTNNMTNNTTVANISQTTDDSLNDSNSVVQQHDEEESKVGNENNEENDITTDGNSNNDNNNFKEAFRDIDINLNNPRIAEHFAPKEYPTTYEEYVKSGRPEEAIITDLPS